MFIFIGACAFVFQCRTAAAQNESAAETLPARGDGAAADRGRCPGNVARQSCTPGQLARFDRNLNLVDSVITQAPSGQIGIGTTHPAAALDVATGDLNLAGNLLKGGTLFMHNSGSHNTFLGENAGNVTMTGEGNTAGGSSAFNSNTSGGANTAFGFAALSHNTTGFGNNASGMYSLSSNTTGFGNVATGQYTLYSNTKGTGNIATGAQTLYSNTTGNGNIATGTNALYNNLTGSTNVAIGVAALLNNTSGSGNIAIGDNALLTNATLGNNIGLGNFADVAQDGLFNATAIGYAAVVNASNKIRLGNSSVSVIEGQVPFTFTSDRNQKENFRPVDGVAVLRKLGDINITSWNYIGHDARQFRHYGPVAQEFFAAFGHDGVGVVGTPTTINSGDLEGILFAAVQALDQQNRVLEQQNAALQRRIEALEHAIDDRRDAAR
jgi:hypothetical protein